MKHLPKLGHHTSTPVSTPQTNPMGSRKMTGRKGRGGRRRMSKR